MECLAVGGIFIAIIVAVTVLSGMALKRFRWLLAEGTPARGILLRVDMTGSKVTGLSGRAIFRRGVTIDIEVPGRKPFEVRTQAYMPGNLVRDVLPGATVEVRIDPKDPSTIAIVGPGVGFAPSIIQESS